MIQSEETLKRKLEKYVEYDKVIKAANLLAEIEKELYIEECGKKESKNVMLMGFHYGQMEAFSHFASVLEKCECNGFDIIQEAENEVKDKKSKG